MNTSLSAYTPLETLLLFQLLKINGVDHKAFGTISELLKKNHHIRDATHYDGSRLSPDALRELFTKLVKDEVRTQAFSAGTADGDAPNGDHSGNPKKRKAPSPPLPSVEDATKNPALIPKLVEKLYATYRAQLTADIREEEQKYQRLQREVQEIERGEWDHELAKQQDANGLERAGSIVTVPTVDAPSRAQETRSTPAASALTADAQNRGASHSPAIPSASPHSRPLQPPTAPPPSLTNGKSSEPGVGRPPTLTSSASPAPISTIQAPSQPSQNTASPYRPPPPPKTPSSSNLPSTIHQSPYPPSQAATGPLSGSQPQPARASISNPAAPPQTHPRYGQPPKSASHPEVDNSHQQLTPTPAARSSHIPPYGPHVPQQPSSQSVPTYTAPYVPPDGQQPRTHPTMAVPSHKGGVILPPFQLDLQPSVPTPQQQPKMNTVATPTAKRGTPKAPATVPVHFPSQVTAPAHALRDEVVRLLSVTPFRHGGPRPPPLTTVSTPSSETKWKRFPPLARGAPVRSPSVSPINDLAPPSFQVPAPKPTAIGRGRPSRQSKIKDLSVSESVLADEDARSVRSTRKRGRRGRGASVTSSAVDSSVRGRTRSHSVASHNDAMSVDELTSAQQVKHEPSTPGMSEEVMPGIEGTSTGAGRRTRGNTSQMARPGKRKREVRDVSETAGSEEALGTPGPQQIVAPRYFSRMSVPLMNDITSHKYASLFSAPVKEKDAEGYKDMIRRPQDLKSIRAAVNVGAKAVAAAASVDTPSGNSPGGGGGNVLLSPSSEVVPPKAIVNSAQLERELMRMFANAVMFNSGEEGVVQDARDMFESVQQAVSNWRSAERTGDSEDVGPEEDNSMMVSSKRRKM